MNNDELIEKLDEIVNASIEKPLTFDEACQFLGMKKSTLYKMTFSKKIPHSKPGGKRIYFKKSDLVNWMLKNPVKTKERIEDEASNYIIKNERSINSERT